MNENPEPETFDLPPAAPAPQAPPPAANPFENVTDKLGRKFDPEKFAVGDDGKPRFDSLGRFVNKHAGKKRPPPEFNDVRGALRTVPDEDGETPTQEDFSEELAAASENPTAESIVGLIQTALMLIGEEEGILTATEKAILRRPLVRVLNKYEVGKDVMPAEVDLILAVLALVAARLQRPKFATKWVKFKAWATGKFFNAKGRQLAQNLRENVGSSVDPKP